MNFRSFLLLLCGFLIFAGSARADDVYILASPEPRKENHKNHSLELLRAALEASKPQYGPYQLRTSTVAMQHKRLLRELADGTSANVTVQVSNPEWDQTLIPIRIPVDKGLSSFRISLIDGQRQAEFKRVNSLAQLKHLAVGVGEQWATRDVYEQNGLRVVTGTSYPGLFGMLMAGRFDYFPRSIEEALVEQKEQQANYPHIAIEQSFMLYTPVPRYYFVSPSAPRLAERLHAGLEKLIANGEFDRYFNEYYGPLIAQAGLCKRTIFRMKNSSLSNKTPLNRTDLWFNPFDAANKESVCRSTQ